MKNSKGGNPDPLLSLHGTGKQLWADEHADVYVRRLPQDSQGAAS